MKASCYFDFLSRQIKADNWDGKGREGKLTCFTPNLLSYVQIHKIHPKAAAQSTPPAQESAKAASARQPVLPVIIDIQRKSRRQYSAGKRSASYWKYSGKSADDKDRERSRTSNKSLIRGPKHLVARLSLENRLLKKA
jgi:hypothetical protein